MTRINLCLIGNPNSIHTRRWTDWFRQRGHKVWLVADVSPEPRWRAMTDFVLPGRFNPSWLKFILWEIKLRRLLKDLKPDILHAHRVSSAGWLGAFTGYHPFVVTPWGSDLYQHPYRSRMAAWLARYVLRRADLVTTGSLDLGKQAVKFGAQPQNIHHIGWGIDLNIFKPGTGHQLRQELGVGDAPLVLSIRAVKPIYNLDVILKAIPRVQAVIPDVIFCFQRYNSDLNYLAFLQRMIEELDVNQCVRWLGEQEAWQEVAAIYRSATLAVSLATTDSMPISLLEVMATGVPVIASDLPSIREWITDGVNGILIPPRDEQALASAIIKLLSNPELSHSFSQYNRKLVAERADHEAEMKKMESLYLNLLKEQKNPR